MRARFGILLIYGAAALLGPGAATARPGRQEAGKSQVAVDPQTGRAVGAKEMAPDELRKLIAEKAKMIIIDVRDEEQYRKETIKGAVHIPLEELDSRLKEIPKETILVFT
jgi:3-mercaptopyruvate sulfurtransferase SseA